MLHTYIHTYIHTQERQREELVGAALLRSIRTDRSSLILPVPISLFKVEEIRLE